MCIYIYNNINIYADCRQNFCVISKKKKEKKERLVGLDSSTTLEISRW